MQNGDSQYIYLLKQINQKISWTGSRHSDLVKTLHSNQLIFHYELNLLDIVSVNSINSYRSIRCGVRGVVTQWNIPRGESYPPGVRFQYNRISIVIAALGSRECLYKCRCTVDSKILHSLRIVCLLRKDGIISHLFVTVMTRPGVRRLK